jgi:hypothetical protein
MNTGQSRQSSRQPDNGVLLVSVTPRLAVSSNVANAFPNYCAGHINLNHLGSKEDKKMETGTYVYSKLFKSGNLVDLEVNCHINNITESEAQRILGVGMTGSDVITGAKWIITSGRWLPSMSPSTVDVQFETAYGQTTRLPFVVRCF